jgi:hypothetical protein
MAWDTHTAAKRAEQAYRYVSRTLPPGSDYSPLDSHTEAAYKAVALSDYFKDQARRVFGALRGYDEKKRLLEDVSRFVAKEGGVWIGTATELHQQFQSDYKPRRAEELSKFIKEAAEDEEGFTYDSDMARYKDESSGEWKSRREITLYRQTP